MTRSEIAALLRARAASLPQLRVVTGFDAFVDEMISVVAERADLNTFKRIETISDFSAVLAAAAGHSSLREIVISQVDPGGCAVNMGDGLATLGLGVTTFATAGQPQHPAFADYMSKAQLHSWGTDPGRTLAFEFADGKLMFSAVTQLAALTPEEIEQRLEDGVFARACAEAELIALTDWTLYPHMTACWHLLRTRVFSKLTHRPRFFFDLVDPSGRSSEDILAMLAELSQFEACGPTSLGLNQNEANILCRLTGCAVTAATTDVATAEQAAYLVRHLGINEVVIHSQRHATSATLEGGNIVTARASGPYCEKPTKSTGAGDRFNAGFALAHLLKLEPEARLTLANATSGLYVRLGRSPNSGELADFLEKWQ